MTLLCVSVVRLHINSLNEILAGLQELHIHDCGTMTGPWLSPDLRKLVAITSLDIGEANYLMVNTIKDCQAMHFWSIFT